MSSRDSSRWAHGRLSVLEQLEKSIKQDRPWEKASAVLGERKGAGELWWARARHRDSRIALAPPQESWADKDKVHTQASQRVKTSFVTPPFNANKIDRTLGIAPALSCAKLCVPGRNGARQADAVGALQSRQNLHPLGGQTSSREAGFWISERIGWRAREEGVRRRQREGARGQHRASSKRVEARMERRQVPTTAPCRHLWYVREGVHVQR
jgi:hypothetical protein